MTTSIEEQSAESPPIGRLRNRVRVLTATVIALAVALLSLAAWTVYDSAAESDTTVAGGIETLVDNYITAWNEHDSEAFLALTTNNYELEYADAVLSAERVAADLSRLEPGDFSVEVIGDPIMSGDGPIYYVAHVGHITERGYDPQNTINVYTIVERDEDYLISHHNSFTESSG